MANGELCRICGEQETPHLIRRYSSGNTCVEFISEIDHDKRCPVLECNGNCAESIAASAWNAKCAERRMSHAWFMQGPNLIVMDIGS